jgi:hypothetical protein
MAGKCVANPTVGQLHYKMAHTSDGRDAGALAHYQPLTCNDSELGWKELRVVEQVRTDPT